MSPTHTPQNHAFKAIDNIHLQSYPAKPHRFLQSHSGEPPKTKDCLTSIQRVRREAGRHAHPMCSESKSGNSEYQAW